MALQESKKSTAFIETTEWTKDGNGKKGKKDRDQSGGEERSNKTETRGKQKQKQNSKDEMNVRVK